MTNRKEIKIWQIKNDVTNDMIAKSANVSRSLVSLVISGQRQNDLVIKAFVKAGCPESHFRQTGETKHGKKKEN